MPSERDVLKISVRIGAISFKNQIMHGAGGLVHVHSVLLVEMFYLLVLFSCKILY